MYIKLAAFGETLYLNLSLNRDWEGRETVVEYVARNGSVSSSQTPQQKPCHYTGVVHSSRLQEEEGGGRERGGLGCVVEGSWTAISTCSGLVRIVTHGGIFLNKSGPLMCSIQRSRLGHLDCVRLSSSLVKCSNLIVAQAF